MVVIFRILLTFEKARSIAVFELVRLSIILLCSVAELWMKFFISTHLLEYSSVCIYVNMHQYASASVWLVVILYIFRRRVTVTVTGGGYFLILAGEYVLRFIVGP